MMATGTERVERGVLLSVGPHPECHVRLLDGRELKAVLAVHALQKKHGCLLGNFAGWTVDVEVFTDERPPRVVSLIGSPAS